MACKVHSWVRIPPQWGRSGNGDICMISSSSRNLSKSKKKVGAQRAQFLLLYPNGFEHQKSCHKVAMRKQGGVLFNTLNMSGWYKVVEEPGCHEVAMRKRGGAWLSESCHGKKGMSLVAMRIRGGAWLQ